MPRKYSGFEKPDEWTDRYIGDWVNDEADGKGHWICISSLSRLLLSVGFSAMVVPNGRTSKLLSIRIRKTANLPWVTAVYRFHCV